MSTKFGWAKPLAGVWLLFVSTGSLAEGSLYWTESNHVIKLADIDGSNPSTVIQNHDGLFLLAGPKGVAINNSAKKIYWANSATCPNLPCQSIARANLDGTDPEIIVNVQALNGVGTFPQAVDIDQTNGKIYWADQVNKIQRSNLDGSNPETILVGKFFRGIALDLINQKMYWAEPVLNVIERANLDGSGAQTLVGGLDNPQWVALDSVNGKVYWTDSNNIVVNGQVGGIARLQRANLDGTSVETLVNTGFVPAPNQSYYEAVKVDPVGGKVYWADVGQKRILTADLNGSNVTTLVADLGSVTGLALELQPPNAAPVADAGLDQSIHAGELVQLDGTGSYDDNTGTDDLIYDWSFVTRPTGSTAGLQAATTATPMFTADLPGSYRVQLVVQDADLLTSAPDDVEVSSLNVAPTAEAGDDRLVFVGQTQLLDGSMSSDPDDDPLDYAWGMVSKPQASVVYIDQASGSISALTPDVPGSFTVSLTVNDGFAASTPDTVTIEAIYPADHAREQLVQGCEAIRILDNDKLDAGGHRNALCNFLTQAMKHIERSELSEALSRIDHAIQRLDGCAITGSFDEKGSVESDWLVHCPTQLAIYEMLLEARHALE